MKRREFLFGASAAAIAAVAGVAVLPEPAFEYIDLSGFTNPDYNGRFKLIDSATGEIQYVGKEPYEGNVQFHTGTRILFTS